MPSWRFVAAAAALLAYAGLSHALMVHAPAHPWSVAALFGPLLAAVALGALRRRQWAAFGLGAVAAAVLAAITARGGVQDMQRMYVLQHAVLHLTLAWPFASTLRAGSEPLLTRLALRMHGRLSPAMRVYTRRLTVAWTGYFVGMVAVSALLYAFAPWRWWSLFGNLLSPLLAASLFVLEHLWRHRHHPEFERASLAAAWRAWQTWQTRPSSGAIR